jgi:putative ABC transport system ATP-binding protein
MLFLCVVCMSYSLSIKDLFFTWSKQSDFALHIPDWQVKTTEKVFLYGRSGEGKSTLLNLISGIQSRYTGNIQVLGQDMSELSQTQKDTFRNTKNTQHTQQSDQLASICERLELNSHLLKQKATELSVGQQQRVAVARALYGSPELIIADEPTSALDTQTREQFIHLLLDCAQSSTVIFVSHDMSLASHFDKQLGLAQLQLRRSETDVT